MTIKVCGHRVLVKPEYPEETTESGIIIGIGREYQLEKNATQIGKVVDIGDTAWSDPGLGGKPWCEIGDRVYFAKYAGKKVEDGKEEYFILNDEDIQAVIGE
jgi:co-chaperonin GroES (HSP10)